MFYMMYEVMNRGGVEVIPISALLSDLIHPKDWPTKLVELFTSRRLKIAFRKKVK